MMRYAYTVRAFFNVTAGFVDKMDMHTKMFEFASNYEISGNEIAGFNSASGTDIISISGTYVPASSVITAQSDGETTALIALDIEVRLRAKNAKEAQAVGRDALELYELAPAFLAAYNQVTGTSFSRFTLDDTDFAHTAVDDEDDDCITIPLPAHYGQLSHLAC